MVFVRELYWFKHFKIIKMKKIRRCSVEGEILIGEDSSQQNHTLTYSGKGYYWGTFLRVCFFWDWLWIAPNEHFAYRFGPGQSIKVRIHLRLLFFNNSNFFAHFYGLVAPNRENKNQGRKVIFPQKSPRGCTDNFFFRYRTFFRSKNDAILTLFKQTLSWFTQTNFVWLNL